jgi:lipoprotein-releasing system ATP-binding protein
MNSPILSLQNVTRTYAQGENALPILTGVNLEIHGGEMAALIGPSGAGKSTLLHIAGILDQPDGGTIALMGQNIAGLDDAARTQLRRASLGFVYQYHHLLPEFSAEENIILPQMINGVSRRDASVRARDLLGQVGLSHRHDHRPARLSGGEQQRVAIARALANRPHLLIADEPTGNLDPKTADDVFALLMGLAKQGNFATLMATHNPALAARMDRVFELKAGQVVQVR